MPLSDERISGMLLFMELILSEFFHGHFEGRSDLAVLVHSTHIRSGLCY